MRRYWVECEEEILVWFLEAVVTPTSKVLFPLARIHENNCPAEQMTTNSNMSSLPHALKSVCQTEGLEPHVGAFEGQNRVC